ncbi:hypothetical protein HYW55_05385 [Candidatus Gottesmanbacteria bacterium]|nr:hypothetical protein [Candidatus Gottesmanbacteria bacterium]
MSKSFLFLLVALGAIAIIGWYGFSTLTPRITEQTTTLEVQPTQSTSFVVNKTAKFAIYTNGTFRVFTASMYLNLSEDVYIQGDSPNVVRVKKEGITWDDFFKTLPFKLTKDCLTTGTEETFCSGQKGTLRFYLNGIKTDDLLTREIEETDKALITYGDQSENQIQEQINQLDK